MCFDGVKRLCHIRGKLRKKVWINQSDIVLIGLRDYQDAKADVILKYSADEARNPKSYGEFPESVKINETVEFGGEGDDDIEFDDVDSDGSDPMTAMTLMESNPLWILFIRDSPFQLAHCKLISHLDLLFKFWLLYFNLCTFIQSIATGGPCTSNIEYFYVPTKG